jgi:hypothetical protein
MNSDEKRARGTEGFPEPLILGDQLGSIPRPGTCNGTRKERSGQDAH